MSNLLSFFWIYIAVAFGLGVAVGLTTWADLDRRGWAGWALALLVAGVIVASLKLLPGRYGFYLELALFVSAAYVAGCWLGAMLRWVFSPKRSTSGSAGPSILDLSTVAAVAPVDAAGGKVSASPSFALPNSASPSTAAVSAGTPSSVASNSVSPDQNGSPGVQPAGLTAAREGKRDDLKMIKGIGKKNEDILQKLGIFHFDQIAAWSGDNIEWVENYLAFQGRVRREDWVGQAKQLALGKETEFANRVSRGEVATSRKGSQSGKP